MHSFGEIITKSILLNFIQKPEHTYMYIINKKLTCHQGFQRFSFCFIEYTNISLKVATKQPNFRNMHH